MAKGKIIYLVASTPTTYTFAMNPRYPYKPGYEDLNSRKLALDGTDYMDAGPIKKTFSLEFRFAPDAQKTAFETAYESGMPVDLYLNADLAKTATIIFTEPPDITREEVPESLWSISVECRKTDAG